MDNKDGLWHKIFVHFARIAKEHPKIGVLFSLAGMAALIAVIGKQANAELLESGASVVSITSLGIVLLVSASNYVLDELRKAKSYKKNTPEEKRTEAVPDLKEISAGRQEELTVLDQNKQRSRV